MEHLYDYFSNARREVAEFLPKMDRELCVLDIGCGTGNFRKNIAVNCEYWGIEPDQAAAEIASSKLDKVLVGTFRQVFEALPNNYFDCVICADVIEHMKNEGWFLQEIKSKMKVEAVIVGSIPNVRFITNLLRLLIWKDWKYVDSGILDSTHLRFFTEKSLIRTLGLNGYLIEEIRGINKVGVNRKSLRNLIVSIGLVAFSYLLGRDSSYLQFGFRVKQRKSPG